MSGGKGGKKTQDKPKPPTTDKKLVGDIVRHLVPDTKRGTRGPK